jgi:hypothetical protein
LPFSGSTAAKQLLGLLLKEGILPDIFLAAKKRNVIAGHDPQSPLRVILAA